MRIQFNMLFSETVFEYCLQLIILLQRHRNINSLSKEYAITKTCPCYILQFLTPVKKDNFQIKNCDIFLMFAL